MRNTSPIDDTVKSYVSRLPEFPQSQIDTEDQLVILWAVANRLGLYDGADHLKTGLIKSGRFVK